LRQAHGKEALRVITEGKMHGKKQTKDGCTVGLWYCKIDGWDGKE
jgi:hypothetical protein